MTDPSRDERDTKSVTAPKWSGDTILPDAAKWSGDDRALVERLLTLAASLNVGKGFEIWIGEKDAALIVEAAAAITSLSEQVEALTIDRSAAIDQGNFWRNYAKDVEHRLAEVRTEEREACATLAEIIANELLAASFLDPGGHIAKKAAQHVASAIRARSDEDRAQDVAEG